MRLGKKRNFTLSENMNARSSLPICICRKYAALKMFFFAKFQLKFKAKKPSRLRKKTQTVLYIEI